MDNQLDILEMYRFPHYKLQIEQLLIMLLLLLLYVGVNN